MLMRASKMGSSSYTWSAASFVFIAQSLPSRSTPMRDVLDARYRDEQGWTHLRNHGGR